MLFQNHFHTLAQMIAAQTNSLPSSTPTSYLYGTSQAPALPYILGLSATVRLYSHSSQLHLTMLYPIR